MRAPDQTSAPRPGSRKRSVYDARHEDPMKLGLSLGLSPSTIKGWLAKWSKKHTIISRVTSVENLPAKMKIKARVLDKGATVYDVSNKKRRGTLINIGEQVSEVRWLGGLRQYISNDYLRRV